MELETIKTKGMKNKNIKYVQLILMGSLIN